MDKKFKTTHLFTTGRSGSSFCAEIAKKNLGITLDEWFSPSRYDYLWSRGIYSSKKSYLLYVYFLLQGGDSTKGVKVTPHVFASKYWEQNITTNPLFTESVSRADDAILLIRKNPIDTVKSYLYSMITGLWHTNSPVQPQKDLSEKELFEFVTSKTIYILDCEIRMIQLVHETQNNYKLFFYEDIDANRELFMRNFLSCFTFEPYKSDLILLTDKEKLTKDHLIEERIEAVLNKVISNNQKIETSLKQRDFILNVCSVYEHHYSLQG